MKFLLPADLAPDAARELEAACITGGPDSMPWPSEVQVQPDRLTVCRNVEESGCLAVPWKIDNVGRLLGSTATLIERDLPYHFLVELARGKVHQLRSQAAEWQSGGLQVTPDLIERIRDASVAFGRAVTHLPSEEAGKEAQDVLDMGYRAAEALVQLYIDQMFQARHLRQPRLDTTLGCRLGASFLTPENARMLLQASNSVALAFSWSEIQPTEGTYSWDNFDTLLNWALAQGLSISAGPLIDFSQVLLPEWLNSWNGDLPGLSSFMCDYVQATLKRYRDKIRSWQITAASNCASVLGLVEDELLWLTVRLVEAARQVDPRAEMIVGIAQPWGEYMAVEDRTHSPFIFADTLIRSGLNLAALDLELIMGAAPRGSYCRDLVCFSRLLDLYSLLGLPLRVTMGYPSEDSPDPRGNPELKVGAGSWHGGFGLEQQADWAKSFTALALCKPTVRGVSWVHLSDAELHQFPHCGLFDARNHPKPVLQRLRELRESHLR